MDSLEQFQLTRANVIAIMAAILYASPAEAVQSMGSEECVKVAETLFDMAHGTKG